MAYLRPLNSSEANLYVIRFTTPDIGTGSNYFETVSSNYYLVKTTTYDNPTIDLLPQGFKYSLGDSTALDYKIEFGSMNNPFTEPPSVNITIMKPTNNTVTITDIDKYIIVIEEITTSYLRFSIRATDGSTNTKITPYDGTTLTSPRFNICIIGSVISGATFAISNRGWSVPESSVNKLYTYQSVGIGTGKIDATFNLKGSMVMIANKVDSWDGVNPTTSTVATSIKSNYLTILDIDTSIGTPTIDLGTGYNGQVVKIIIKNTSNLTAGSLSILGSCLDTNQNLPLISTSSLKKNTELYFDLTVNKWMLLYQV